MENLRILQITKRNNIISTLTISKCTKLASMDVSSSLAWS